VYLLFEQMRKTHVSLWQKRASATSQSCNQLALWENVGRRTQSSSSNTEGETTPLTSTSRQAQKICKVP